MKPTMITAISIHETKRTELSRLEKERRLKVIDEVYAVLTIAGETTYIDDHTQREERLEGIVHLDTDYICPIFTNNLCSLNELYVGIDGKIHLSKSAVAGVFRPVLTSNDKETNFKAAVERYNETTSWAKIKSYKVM